MTQQYSYCYVRSLAHAILSASKTVDNTVEVVFQVNGKVRARETVSADMDKALLEKLAMENERVQEFMAGKLVNIVVK